MLYFRADLSSLEVADHVGSKTLFDRDERHVVQLEVGFHPVFLGHLESCLWFCSSAFGLSMLTWALHFF